jgi:hypothetical protein
MLQAEPLAALEVFLPLVVAAGELADLQQEHPAQVAQALMDWPSSQPISKHEIRSN